MLCGGQIDTFDRVIERTRRFLRIFQLRDTTSNRQSLADNSPSRIPEIALHGSGNEGAIGVPSASIRVAVVPKVAAEGGDE